MDLSSETLAKRPAMEVAPDAGLGGRKATPQTWSWCSFMTCSRVRILVSHRRAEKSHDPAHVPEETGTIRIVHGANSGMNGSTEWHGEASRETTDQQTHRKQEPAHQDLSRWRAPSWNGRTMHPGGSSLLHRTCGCAGHLTPGVKQQMPSNASVSQ